MREVANPYVELSHPPTPRGLDIYAHLECNPDGFHVAFSSQPLSYGSFDPTDCTVLCSPIQTPPPLFTRIKLLMELVLSSQPALYFFTSMCGNLKKNLWWKMNSFYLCLIHFFLTSFLTLPFLISLVKFHSWMFILLIIQRTHRMSFYHLIVERKHPSFWIYPIYHLFFLEIHRVNFFFLIDPFVQFVRSWGFWCTSWIFWSWLSWSLHSLIQP